VIRDADSIFRFVSNSSPGEVVDMHNDGLFQQCLIGEGGDISTQRHLVSVLPTVDNVGESNVPATKMGRDNVSAHLC